MAPATTLKSFGVPPIKLAVAIRPAARPFQFMSAITDRPEITRALPSTQKDRPLRLVPLAPSPRMAFAHKFEYDFMSKIGAEMRRYKVIIK